MSLSSARKRKASQAVLRLAEADKERQQRRRMFANARWDDSDEESFSPCTVFDLVINGRSWLTRDTKDLEIASIIVHCPVKTKSGIKKSLAKEFRWKFFARLCTLWAIVSDKYRWSFELYEPIFRCCVALTNVHVQLHRLRGQDGDDFIMYLARLKHIGHDIIESRKSTQKRYREKHRLRIQPSVMGVPCDSGYISDLDYSFGKAS
ncbi:hypothetical protein Ae201684_009223 [Aphanomyces euteiches]|uniref:DDE Tnp4 domain-containing protein n=1 Tax=Aphanomyces euteiches TaxID=100861 RepID=A0A6G0X2J1_9STRA|nr:hypothetical protein Ae201684_009223 [Aphanomyces euteiches]